MEGYCLNQFRRVSEAWGFLTTTQKLRILLVVFRKEIYTAIASLTIGAVAVYVHGAMVGVSIASLFIFYSLFVLSLTRQPR